MNLLFRIIRKMRSSYLTKKFVDSGDGNIKLATAFYKVKIEKAKDAIFELNGKLIFMNYYNDDSGVSIVLGKNSKLKIEGDFVIGAGVKIEIMDGGELTIGGLEKESSSGITSHTIILVHKKVNIGKDFLCSWNVFITDSDWHRINNSETQADVNIEDHVWIGNNCNILKGSNIGKNAVVSAYSKITKTNIPNNTLVGGIPAKILKENIEWHRDF